MYGGRGGPSGPVPGPGTLTKKRTMTDSVRNDEELAGDELAAEAEGADAPETAEDGPEDPEGSSGSVGSGDADNSGGARGAAVAEEVEGDEELDVVKDELDVLNDRHLRLVAEFNNFRRRTEQERLGAWARAQADLVAKFLDVLDDLSRVADLDLSNATVEAIMEGVDLVERKFVRVLEDSGVEVIDPTGEAFDPECMEAMMRIPAESEEQDDEVAQVFQKGYSLKGVLVRPARVSVYKQG